MLLTSNFVRGKVMDVLDFKVGTEILIRKVMMSCSDGDRNRESALRPTSNTTLLTQDRLVGARTYR